MQNSSLINYSSKTQKTFKKLQSNNRIKGTQGNKQDNIKTQKNNENQQNLNNIFSKISPQKSERQYNNEEDNMNLMKVKKQLKETMQKNTILTKQIAELELQSEEYYKLQSQYKKSKSNENQFENTISELIFQNTTLMNENSKLKLKIENKLNKEGTLEKDYQKKIIKSQEFHEKNNQKVQKCLEKFKKIYDNLLIKIVQSQDDTLHLNKDTIITIFENLQKQQIKVINKLQGNSSENDITYKNLIQFSKQLLNEISSNSSINQEIADLKKTLKYEKAKNKDLIPKYKENFQKLQQNTQLLKNKISQVQEEYEEKEQAYLSQIKDLKKELQFQKDTEQSLVKEQTNISTLLQENSIIKDKNEILENTINDQDKTIKQLQNQLQEEIESNQQKIEQALAKGKEFWFEDKQRKRQKGLIYKNIPEKSKIQEPVQSVVAKNTQRSNNSNSSEINQEKLKIESELVDIDQEIAQINQLIQRELELKKASELNKINDEDDESNESEENSESQEMIQQTFNKKKKYFNEE